MRTNTHVVAAWLARLAVVAFAALFSVAANAQGGRVLANSDVVSIKVVSQPDMDTTTRVESDGTVNFPYVGRIRAAGLTEDQLAHAIERRLAQRQIVTDPHVLVEITGFGAQASVQGQVGAPGVYTLDRPTTLAQILARAGGLRESGGTVIVRRNGTVRRYYARDLLNGNVNPDRILINNNDRDLCRSRALLLRVWFRWQNRSVSAHAGFDRSAGDRDRGRPDPARNRFQDEDQAQDGGRADRGDAGFAGRRSGAERHDHRQRTAVLTASSASLAKGEWVTYLGAARLALPRRGD